VSYPGIFSSFSPLSGQARAPGDGDAHEPRAERGDSVRRKTRYYIGNFQFNDHTAVSWFPIFSIFSRQKAEAKARQDREEQERLEKFRADYENRVAQEEMLRSRTEVRRE